MAGLDGSAPRDNSTFTSAQFIGTWRKIVCVIFYYVVLMLFRACLVLSLRLNKVTVCNFEFHCAAMDMLHTTTALLNMRNHDYRSF